MRYVSLALELGGFALLVYGLYLVWMPAAVVVAGLLLLAGGVVVEPKRKRQT